MINNNYVSNDDLLRVKSTFVGRISAYHDF